jgi:hypothetical protein
MFSSSALGQYLDFALNRLPLTLLVVGLAFALLALVVMRKPHSGRRIVEVLFRSYLFWTIGVLFLYGAITKGALGASAIAAIHASAVVASPEAAYAELAFAIIALLAAVFGSIGLRFAAVLAPAIYVFAPIALNEPATLDTVIAHAPLAAIYALGLFYCLLQAGAGRPQPIRHRAPDISDIVRTS